MLRKIESAIFAAICVLGFHASAQTETESLTIHPADELHIKVLESSDLEQVVRVNDAGMVSLILGGNVKVAGMTPPEAERTIESALRRGQYVLDPHVSVIVQQYAITNVIVAGQVRLSGSYQIGTPRSIVDVIALAGGLTDLADRKVTIEKRDSKERVEYMYSNNPATALDKSVLVYPGDRVFVPKVSVVYLLGDVNRPGGIAMATNDSTLSVLQALTLAGGTPPTAVPSHARLIRKKADGSYVEIHLPLSDMQKGKLGDFALQPDDIIYVPFSYLRAMALGVDSLVAATATAAIYRF